MRRPLTHGLGPLALDASEKRGIFEFDLDISRPFCRRFTELSPAHDSGEGVGIIALQHKHLDVFKIALLMQEFDRLVDRHELGDR